MVPDKGTRKMKKTVSLLVLGCILAISVSAAGQALNDQACRSRFANRQLGPKLLAAILVDHQAWFTQALENAARFDENDPRRANLCRANLAGANLQRAFLDRAFLQEANLHGADLRQADLSSANLVRADLSQSKLQHAFLVKSSLQLAIRSRY